MWTLQIASNGKIDPQRDYSPEHARKFTAQHQLRYYNEEVHRAAFALPGFVRKMVNEDGSA
jgi:spermidine synthase